jgi:hypothetical protein
LSKIISAAAASAILLSLAACSKTGDTASSSDIVTSAENAVSSAENTSSDSAEASSETGSSALELIGVQIGEDGEAAFDKSSWEISEDYDIFREYFFGEWDSSDTAFAEGQFIIDDSEKAYLSVNNHVFRFDNFYKVSDDVLAFILYGDGESELFWLDKAAPDAMYYLPFNGNSFYDFDIRQNADLFTKAEKESNAPENGFMSVYRLRELSRDYGIDWDMLTNIEYEPEGSPDKLSHDDWYEFYPVYLMSESADKLTFETTVGNVMTDDEEIRAEFTIEKIDGEWTRTVEFG